MSSKKELEALRDELRRKLRHVRRQGYIPGKSVDIAAVEKTIEQQLRDVDDRLRQIELSELGF